MVRDNKNYRGWKNIYYLKNKEKICEKQNEERKTWTAEKREEYAAKQREYYLARKAAGSLEQKKFERKLVSDFKKENAPPKPPKEPKEPKPPKEPRPPRERKIRQPKEYLVTEKKEPIFGTARLKQHQKKRLEELNPLGFYQPPEVPNPFKLTWD